jgi:hypothetical protein
MIFSAFNKGLEGMMSAAWKGTRNVVDGARGTTKYIDEAGEQVRMNPAQRLARRLKNDVYQMKGVKRDMKGRIDPEYEMSAGERFAGAGHLVGDALTAPLQMIGWGARGGTMLGLGVGAAVGKPIGKAAVMGTGHMAKQGIDFVGDTAIGAAELVGAMNKSHLGRDMLFVGGAAGALTVGGGKALSDSWGSDAIGKQAMQFYNGRPIDSLPGTITPSNTMVDSMGAGGDVVLAMHNMR